MYYKEKKKIANFRITMGILFVVLGVIFAFTPLGQLEGGMISPSMKTIFSVLGIVLGIFLVIVGVISLAEIKSFMQIEESNTNEDNKE